MENSLDNNDLTCNRMVFTIKDVKQCFVKLALILELIAILVTTV